MEPKTRKVITLDQVEGAQQGLKDQFNNFGDSSWLEGWACGFTDPEHGYENGDEIREYLIHFIGNLK